MPRRNRSARREPGGTIKRPPWRRRSDRARLRAAVARSLVAQIARGELDGPDDLDATFEKTILKQVLRLPRADRRLGPGLPDVIVRAATAAARRSVTLHASGIDARLADHRSAMSGFAERLALRWARGLDELDAYRFDCIEIGSQFNQRHDRDEGDWTYQAIIQLHARACRIAGEVLVLLRAGYASGAHARWRSLHEVAVVACFLSAADDDTAEGYLLHGDIESYRALADFQRHASTLGYEPFTADEEAEIRAAWNHLLERFGLAYRSPYGWAARSLGRANPTFRDIEDAVSLDHLRPYYRMASHPTHAGPKAISFDIGLARHYKLVAGPTNAGLAEPGHSTAISLLQITCTLLALEPRFSDIAAMLEMVERCDSIGSAFLDATRQLETEIMDDDEPVDLAA